MRLDHVEDGDPLADFVFAPVRSPVSPLSHTGKRVSFAGQESQVSPSRLPALGSSDANRTLHTLQEAQVNLEHFLDHRKSFAALFTDFRAGAFGKRLREAMAVKKAAHAFLSVVGRKPTVDAGAPPPERSNFLVKDSAILDRAKAKLSGVPSAAGPPQYPSPLGSLPPVTSRYISEERRLLLPQVGRARRVQQIFARVSENPAAGGSPPPPLPALRQEPAGAVPGPAVGAWRLKSRVAAVSKTAPQKSEVLIVTGSVSYPALLAQQELLHKEVEAGNENYQKLISTYDSIQHDIQRRLSLFLSKKCLTGLSESMSH
ncbi:hypothetical protein DIPPA_02509 [Diplonema papillatum]|nr:hypothetical protein DIPPA_02509 [Diplonema papillatum]